VSDIEEENLLDVDTAEVHPETPNTFGRNLLRRLGIAHMTKWRQRPPAPHPLLIIRKHNRKHDRLEYCASILGVELNSMKNDQHFLIEQSVEAVRH